MNKYLKKLHQLHTAQNLQKNIPFPCVFHLQISKSRRLHSDTLNNDSNTRVNKPLLPNLTRLMKAFKLFYKSKMNNYIASTLNMMKKDIATNWMCSTSIPTTCKKNGCSASWFTAFSSHVETTKGVNSSQQTRDTTTAFLH